MSDGIELPLIRSRMERVFFNLIANALEAMPAWGRPYGTGRSNILETVPYFFEKGKQKHRSDLLRL